MNRIFLNLSIAIKSLLNFKLRTSLAILGVLLGTFSLIVVSNLTKSLTKRTIEESESFGKNLLIVRSGIVRKMGTSTRLLSEATTLKVEDGLAIMQGSKLINDISPSGNKPFPVRYKSTILKSVLCVGVTPNYENIRNFHVATGRFITEEDNKNVRKVAVIGEKVAERLFKDEDPINKYILIWRVPCQVIGVMEEKGIDISGVDQDNQIFLPLNTYLRRFINKDYINNISVQVVDEKAIPLAKKEIEDILRKRHKIKNSDDFTVIDLKDVMSLKTQAMSMIKTLGNISAILSFLIGGVGILSIMILIVNERRLEIGIRRAVGSRKRDIVYQFLIESSFISFIGGTIGVFISLISSSFIFKITNLPFTLSPFGFIVSFFASVLIGIIAGIYPSQKATKIQPVEVIRK